MGRGTRGKRSMKKGHVYRTHFPKVALFQQLFKGSALALRCCYNGMKDEEKALEKAGLTKLSASIKSTDPTV